MQARSAQQLSASEARCNDLLSRLLRAEAEANTAQSAVSVMAEDLLGAEREAAVLRREKAQLAAELAESQQDAADATAALQMERDSSAAAVALLAGALLTFNMAHWLSRAALHYQAIIINSRSRVRVRLGADGLDEPPRCNVAGVRVQHQRCLRHDAPLNCPALTHH